MARPAKPRRRGIIATEKMLSKLFNAPEVITGMPRRNKRFAYGTKSVEAKDRGLFTCKGLVESLMAVRAAQMRKANDAISPTVKQNIMPEAPQDIPKGNTIETVSKTTGERNITSNAVELAIGPMRCCPCKIPRYVADKAAGKSKKPIIAEGSRARGSAKTIWASGLLPKVNNRETTNAMMTVKRKPTLRNRYAREYSCRPRASAES